jgi:hypothetical protein
MSGKGSHKVPFSAIDQGGDVLWSSLATDCGDECTIRRPGKASEKTHLIAFEVGIQLLLLGDIFKILDSPNGDFFVFT